ncbi:hypothetical protein [Streptomyces sp. NPDC002520]
MRPTGRWAQALVQGGGRGERVADALAELFAVRDAPRAPRGD